MKRTMLVSSIVVLAGCSTAEARQREALMDQIEDRVQLPKDAGPMASYRRYYASSGDGKVTAVYLMPFDDGPRPGDICEEILTDFTTREVPCEPMEFEWEIPAGERKWLSDHLSLPFINDGGCMQVTIEYDVKADQFTMIECNGVV